MSLEPGRIFAIGDIHGCADKLATLLERLRIDSDNDTLVFLDELAQTQDGRHCERSEAIQVELQCTEMIGLLRCARNDGHPPFCGFVKFDSRH